MAGPQTAPATGTATVCVACKLPHGLWLRAFRESEEQELVLGGGMRTVKVFREVGDRFRINGNALPALRDPEREYPQISSGAALTYGVPADLWAAWHEANKDSQMVRNGLIYASERPTDAIAFAKDSRDQRSGLEPLAKDGDPRMPRRIAMAAAASSDAA